MKNNNSLRFWSLLIVLLLVTVLFSVTNVGAGTADCTSETGIKGNVVLGETSAVGTADNCTTHGKALEMVSYKIFSDGTYQEMKRVTTTLSPGENATLEVPVAKCATKIVFFTGKDEYDKDERIARIVINHQVNKGGYFCDQQPPN